MRTPQVRETADVFGLAGGHCFLGGLMERRSILEHSVRHLVPACRGFQSASFRNELVQLLRRSVQSSLRRDLNNDQQRGETSR